MTYYNKQTVVIKRALYDLYVLYPENDYEFYIDKLVNMGFVSADFNQLINTCNQWFKRNNYFRFERVSYGRGNIACKKIALKPLDF
jgi:hypothetical protein